MTTAAKGKPQDKRCALYTRKSSDEGLEQEFNSLDAQREACAAYVQSQKSEGWKPLAAIYDDGGYSGGSMERPALKRLLADIEKCLIDVVVVYKIDRLTRSLADFARMVELFDHHHVSFVSVTQTFNTTTSMGRLTLNVLLSFAQFEREVTGERIRDKIAASKAKGMWMGGPLPLGYDRPTDGSRTLTINEDEAKTVRLIYASYQELGSVHELERHLVKLGVRSKLNITAKGNSRGGLPFSRGALFHLLRNRIYRGEIIHHRQAYPGLHQPIIDIKTFETVQTLLDSRTRRKEARHERRVTPAMFTGRIFDTDGNPMSPTIAYSRHRTIYRYYVSAPLQQGNRRAADDKSPRRVSAAALEQHLASRLITLLDQSYSDAKEILREVNRVEVLRKRCILRLPIRFLRVAAHRLMDGETAEPDPDAPNNMILHLPLIFSTKQGRTHIVSGDQNGPRPDAVLIRALRKAHSLVKRDSTGLPVIDAAPTTPYQNRIVRLAFLAPDIQRDIILGQHPKNLTLAALTDGPTPVLWSQQRYWIESMRQDIETTR